MNLQTLLDTIYEDLNARVNSVLFDAEGDLRLQIEFDSVVMPEGKQHVELKCVQPKEFTVPAGYVGTGVAIIGGQLDTRGPMPPSRRLARSCIASRASIDR
jgi:hypothetical protein